MTLMARACINAPLHHGLFRGLNNLLHNRGNPSMKQSHPQALMLSGTCRVVHEASAHDATSPKHIHMTTLMKRVLCLCMRMRL